MPTLTPYSDAVEKAIAAMPPLPVGENAAEQEMLAALRDIQHATQRRIAAALDRGVDLNLGREYMLTTMMAQTMALLGVFGFGQAANAALLCEAAAKGFRNNHTEIDARRLMSRAPTPATPMGSA